MTVKKARGVTFDLEHIQCLHVAVDMWWRAEPVLKREEHLLH